MIQNLTLTSFTNFRHNKFTFCKGVNVFIGKNATGKTHILKLLAATVNANNIFLGSVSQSKEKIENLVAESLVYYFKPEQLGRLAKRQQGRTTAEVCVEANKKSIEYSFSLNSKTSVNLVSNSLNKELNTLYIPPREMFSLYDGFLGLVKNREVSFDAPYVKLAEALNAPLLKGPRLEGRRVLIEPLEDALKIKVIKENGRFYIKDNSGKMEAHLVAEGVRKLASVMYLILNGELSQKTILFWDEPESNLNPALIKTVALFIKTLAQNGVQLFIASHDYLLTHLLSLYAEYPKESKSPEMKFFCLEKNEEGNIDVEEGRTLVDISNNPILDEYEAYYDLQQMYLSKTV